VTHNAQFLALISTTGFISSFSNTINFAVVIQYRLAIYGCAEEQQYCVGQTL